MGDQVHVLAHALSLLLMSVWLLRPFQPSLLRLLQLHSLLRFLVLQQHASWVGDRVHAHAHAHAHVHVLSSPPLLVWLLRSLLLLLCLPQLRFLLLFALLLQQHASASVGDRAHAHVHVLSLPLLLCRLLLPLLLRFLLLQTCPAVLMRVKQHHASASVGDQAHAHVHVHSHVLSLLSMTKTLPASRASPEESGVYAVQRRRRAPMPPL